MTNQSACRSGRSGYPGSYTERPASRPGRTAPGTGYTVPRGAYSTPRTQRPSVERESCGCDSHSDSSTVCVSAEQFPIGMTYTPMQSWENLYCPSQALEQGTLFIDLDKPFIGRRTSR